MNNMFFMTNGLTLLSFIFVLLIFILFLLKGKVDKISSKLFICLVIMSIISCIFYIGWGSLCFNAYDNLAKIFARICSFLFIMWDFLLLIYLIFVINEEEHIINKFKDNKMVYIISIFLFIIINILLCVFLDVSHYRGSSNVPFIMNGVLFTYYNILSFVLLLVCVILFIININKFDKITKILSIPTILIIAMSIMLSSFKILVINDVCFRFVTLIVFLYFSIESFDGNLLKNFNESVVKASESNKLKEKFFMSMSHQLRSPLNSILGFSDLVTDSSEMEKNILLSDINNIKYSSEKLKTLINSILDISKLESNKEVVCNENYNLENVIFDISSNINSKLKNNLLFSINVDEICPNDLIGDAKKLCKILNIIISNAINCTEYGEVCLNVSCIQIDSLNYEFTFLIKNNGHVMNKDDFNKSFDDLILLSSNGTEINTDVLKIIVAKRLLELIDGKIEFINESGNGTQYIITLKQKLYSENRIGNIRDKIQTKQLFNNLNVDVSGKKILIVDDERVSCVVVERFLKTYNISVDKSLEVNDAVNLITSNNYDCLFINCNMKDTSSDDFINRLNLTGNRIPPVIGFRHDNVKINKDNYNYIIDMPIELKKLDKIFNSLFGGDR